MTDLTGIKKRFSALNRLLDERARRLVAGGESFEVIVNLIAATNTAKGNHAELDSGAYSAGTKIEDHELAGVRLRRDKFHGDRNYEIHPHPATRVALD